MITTIVLALLAADAAKSEAPKEAPKPEALASFAQPESAYWDATAKLWYVSSVAGSPAEKDGKGWITTVGADGKVIDQRWIDGLNAPKGIRTHAGKLYVADIDEVVVVDIKAKKIAEKVKVGGAKLLNDLAVSDKGVVYVTDTFGDAIYELQAGKPAKLLVKSEALEGPNGILVEGNRLVVACFGTITDPAKWATKGPGKIVTVDLKTKKVATLGKMKPLGNLDGLEKMKGGYLVSDYMAGKVYQVSNEGEAFVVGEGYKASADIGYDEVTKRLGIPEMGGDKVTFADLGKN
ncbi:MAG: ATP/GTP-binding protein [Deltaproteobacteria bacterium]|nr:ATP/GTP-binding protein [Deltaproteobacteria bacterium]